MTGLLADIYPLKAQYGTCEPVGLMLEFTSPAPAGLIVRYSICLLSETVLSGQACIDEGACSHVLYLQPLHSDFCGYGVRAEAEVNGVPSGVVWTAFDTVSDYRRAPRYGFLSDFYGSVGEDSSDISSLLRLHINLVQFYDWMYRHECLVPATELYTDIMGKKSDLSIVRDKISRCHGAGMKAMAYGAIYAASEEFYHAHKGWSLAFPDGSPITFIDKLYIMDISSGSPWRKHILGQFGRVLSCLGFDGIHMDTYGYPKTAHRQRDGGLEPVSLMDEFPSLINENSVSLSDIKPDACVIFNNVGGWPVEKTAAADVSAVYVEVWEPYSRYVHIRNIILYALSKGGGKPVILAAYLKPFRTCGADSPGAQWASVYLTSILFAHGAGYLLMGEERAVLTQGYYVDYTVISKSHFARMRRYYDFCVRYLSVLYDPGLLDVSDTHAYGDNMEYLFSGARFSSDGSPGTVWTIIRESAARKVISLVNLTGCKNDLWNEPKEEPKAIGTYGLDIQLSGLPSRVYRACPETDGGEARAVGYSVSNSTRGLRLCAEIGQPGIWEMIIIQM